MTRHSADDPRWIKSSYSGTDTGNCLECRCADPASIAIRDTKARSLGTLVVPSPVWHAFINALTSHRLH
ncbi:DUF397 domain-containing protein [Streptomyces sp. N2-109]|uniref:DUF397 domain-containing protein n=1 Tax=Streptomyces gossypii TaxID=2883101 RepID=A0ABT2K2G5_9ACTN|nr:DUF397 domain-containing protein [Streptomyces gossypii]MCT2594176.1 DUF397 domain-containing protein [Streptomyces gossypii]